MLASAFSANAGTVATGDIRLPSSQATGDGLARQLVDGPLRTFEAKEHLFRVGDPVTSLYRVEAGHVCVYRMMPDGRRQVIDFAYPGDVVGLGAMGEHAVNAQAMTRTCVRTLPHAALQQVILGDARLGLRLYEAMSRELSATRELLFSVSQRTATERVAAFLLALSRRNERIGEDAHEFVLPMTRCDIADFLGLTIETVSRTFTRLRSEGVINVAQSVLVTIRDCQGLVRLAEGRDG